MSDAFLDFWFRMQLVGAFTGRSAVEVLGSLVAAEIAALPAPTAEQSAAFVERYKMRAARR